jgi:hypothetical protein
VGKEREGETLGEIRLYVHALLCVQAKKRVVCLSDLSAEFVLSATTEELVRGGGCVLSGSSCSYRRKFADIC